MRVSRCRKASARSARATAFRTSPRSIPTERKVELIDALARTGLRRLEVTSFVRPDVIPQLADAAEVLARIDVPRGGRRQRADPQRARPGAMRWRCARLSDGARAAFDEINVFLSASETHNRKNVNRSIEESLDGAREACCARARAAGLRCEAVISTSFGCPYEGRVPPERVLEIAARLRDAGAQEIGFGDTTGMANPRSGGRALHAQAATRELGEGVRAHRALPQHPRAGPRERARRAWRRESTSFESSFGELGGCPVPAGATGNIATEDLVSMLHEMGIATGVDLDALLACARRVQEVLGRPLGSHTLVAGPVEWRTASMIAA